MPRTLKSCEAQLKRHLAILIALERQGNWAPQVRMPHVNAVNRLLARQVELVESK